MFDGVLNFVICCFLSLQGINGILADEMGLGKTVQSIAFLCHIAEKYGECYHPFEIYVYPGLQKYTKTSGKYKSICITRTARLQVDFVKYLVDLSCISRSLTVPHCSTHFQSCWCSNTEILCFVARCLGTILDHLSSIYSPQLATGNGTFCSRLQGCSILGQSSGKILYAYVFIL